MDTLGALALATEPPSDELMKRPPVGRKENFITRIMWRNIIGQSIYQLIVLGLLMFDGKRLLKIRGLDADSVLNTFIFNTFVFCQVSIVKYSHISSNYGSATLLHVPSFWISTGLIYRFCVVDFSVFCLFSIHRVLIIIF